MWWLKNQLGQAHYFSIIKAHFQLFYSLWLIPTTNLLLWMWEPMGVTAMEASWQVQIWGRVLMQALYMYLYLLPYLVPKNWEVHNGGWWCLPFENLHYKALPWETPARGEAYLNYHLSSARCMVENAFGIFTQIWRVYQWQIQLEPDTVDKVTVL